MTYRVAIIGLGRVAWRGWGVSGLETHADGVHSCPNTWLSTACDADEGVRAEFSGEYPGVPVVREAQIAAEHADIVSICTPADTHAAIIEQIVEVPTVKAIICEKPLGTTVAEAERIVKLCRNRVLIVGHQRRYETAHRAIQRFVDGGALGHILAAKAWFSGGYLNNGTHAADICRFLVGDSIPWSIERREEDGFGVMVAGENGNVFLSSYGRLKPGYMTAMYADAVGCIKDIGRVPQCSGDDGVEAVRHALFAEERDAGL